MSEIRDVMAIVTAVCLVGVAGCDEKKGEPEAPSSAAPPRAKPEAPRESTDEEPAEGAAAKRAAAKVAEPEPGEELGEVETTSYQGVRKVVLPGDADDWIGQSLSSTGHTLLVGGAHKDGRGDREMAYLIAPKASANCVSAPCPGADEYFWSLSAKLVPRTDRRQSADYTETVRIRQLAGATSKRWRFGIATALRRDGELPLTAVVGATHVPRQGSGVGAAYVFRRVSGDFSEKIDGRLGQVARLEPIEGAGNHCGKAVDLRGRLVAVGCPGYGGGYGSVHLFELDERGRGRPVARLAGEPEANYDGRFGQEAIELTDEHLYVGALWDRSGGDRAGAVWVYDLERRQKEGTSRVVGVDGSEKLLAPNPRARENFGRRILAHDDSLIVSAPGPRTGGEVPHGTVYVFGRESLEFRQRLRIDEPPAPSKFGTFGTSLTIHQGELVVGAPGFDDGRGRIYRYEKTGGRWRRVGSLADPRGEPGDRFGSSLASLTRFGGILAVGARQDDARGEDSGSIVTISDLDAVGSPPEADAGR